MTTASTTLLGLALPVTGELSGTWGDVVNASLTNLLDTAIAGTTTLSSDADVTLSTTTLSANQARQAVILWTAGGTATRTITAPAQSKPYIIINKTSSSQSIKIVGVGPTTGVTIVAGTAALVAWNGVDFVTVSVTSTTGILPVANGGTGLASGTSGGVLAYTATGTLASSGLLAASALVLGGGAGAAPSTTTTGTGVVTALGVNTGTAGAFVVNGGALGSPSSAGTIPAFTLGGTVAGGGNQLNNVIIGTTTPLAGAFTTITGGGRLQLTALGSPPASGSGLELGGGSSPIIFSYNRTSSAYLPLDLTASAFGWSISGTSIGTFSSTGINGMAIGATTAAAGKFTTLSSSGAYTAAANIGITRTPLSSTSSVIKTLEIGAAGTGTTTFFGQTNVSAGGIATNTIFDASNNSVYATTAAVSYLYMYNGSTKVQYASGTQGNTFTPTTIGEFSSTGLAVTGTLSATSDFTLSGTVGRVVSDANSKRVLIAGGATATTTTGAYAIFEGYDYGGAGAGGAISLVSAAGTTNPITMSVGGTTRGVFSSTGLAVTGTIKGTISGLSSGAVIEIGNAVTGVFGGLGISDGGTYPVQLWGSSLAFLTGNPTYGSATEKMRLNSSGNLGIGTTAPFTRLESAAARATTLNSIASFNTMAASVTDTTAFAVGVGGGINFRAQLTASTYSTYASIWSFRENATTNDYRGSLIFGTADNGDGYPEERARFNSTGALVFAGGTTTANGIGITFPATQSASTDANTLDDYEEGTFTPTITAITGSFTTITNQVGKYTKIGNVVNVYISFAISSIGTASNGFNAGNLQFANVAAVNSPVSGVNVSTDVPFGGYVSAGGTSIRCFATLTTNDTYNVMATYFTS